MGPGHVLPDETARVPLKGLVETASGEWAFPGRNGDEPLSKDNLHSFRLEARDAAKIVAGVRPHDLRHVRTSYAVMNGKSLHVGGPLFRNRRTSMTSRHVHVDDASLSEAAERVALSIVRKLYSSTDHATASSINFDKCHV